MRWELSAEQDDFRSVLRDWLRARCAPNLRGWLDDGDVGPFERDFIADGWFAVGSPEDLGGQGGGLVELALVAEELGRAAAPSAVWLGSMLAIPGLAPDAAKALLADGVTTVLAVPADRVPGIGPAGLVPGVLGADRARRLLVPTGQGLLAVEAADVETRPRALVDRTRSVADVTFDAAGGSAVPEDIALRAAVLTAADSLGVAEWMLDMTVEYTLQRKQFGVQIGSFQAVKHAAAEMLVQVEAARSIVYLAAASVEAGHPDARKHAAAAKAQVTAGAAKAADTALTLHGAIGYTWEHDLQLYYKRAKLNSALFGSPRAWNERLASELDLVPR